MLGPDVVRCLSGDMAVHGGDGSRGPIPAVVDAVYGAFSPSGRLPYTMYDAAYITRSNFFAMSMTAAPGRSCACVFGCVCACVCGCVDGCVRA